MLCTVGVLYTMFHYRKLYYCRTAQYIYYVTYTLFISATLIHIQSYNSHTIHIHTPTVLRVEAGYPGHLLRPRAEQGEGVAGPHAEAQEVQD